MQITKSKPAQALPILFLIFLLQSLFFIYIDEGAYSFNGLATTEGGLVLVLWTSVFTLIGFMLFSIFNKIGRIPFVAKIILAAILTAPTAMMIWSMLYLTFKT